MVGLRKPLGMMLQNSILPGDQPPLPGDDGPFGFPAPHALPQTGAPEKPGFFKEGGMGRIIAGLIGDALLQQSGMRPVYSPMMQQRQQAAAEEAQWSRRRQAEQQDWQARQEYERANPAPSAMERNLAVWQGMTPEQRQAYQEMQDAQSGPITTTLPNGQLYVGPKSGLATALSGGVPRPVGKLTPIDGGPQVAPAATFRP